MLVSGNEAIFEGSEIEGARRRRRRYTQGGGRKDLLCFDAHHKALAKETSRERGCRAQADPWQASQEGSDAQRVAAPPPAGQRRPHPRRAQRGFRGGVRPDGLHLHCGEGYSPPARWRMATQKKSKIASERDEEA